MDTGLYSIIDSPIGKLMLVGEGRTLTGLYMENYKAAWARHREGRRDDAALKPAREQLTAYFAGELKDFDLHLDGQGTEFQRKVWTALCAIPYGETVSYGEIARRIGHPEGPRAVGLANGQNPIAVIVPCHRVIGANGTLTGYGGGLPRKKWLLAHEAGHSGLFS